MKNTFARENAIRSMTAMAEAGDVDATSKAAIARRAYDKFVGRGRVDGFDLQDWLTAEREVRAEMSSQYEAN